MVETDTPPDVLDGAGAGTTESIRWIGILILLALLSILVAVWAVAPRPVWCASEVVLFVLAALLFSLVAIFLAVSEYHEWLVRTQEGVRPIVAELRRLQETQTRLDATVGKGHQELTTLARQAERTQRELGSHLAGAWQAVTAQVTALGQAHQSSGQQAAREAIATLTGAQATLTADIQKLQAAIEAMAGGITEIRHTSEEVSGIAARQTTIEEAWQAREEAVRAVLAALGAGQEQMSGALQQLCESTQQVASVVVDTAREQSATDSSLQAVLAAAGELTAVRAEQSAIREAVQNLGPAVTQVGAQQVALAEAVRSQEQAINTAVASLVAYQGQLAGDLRGLSELAQGTAGCVTVAAREQAAVCSAVPDGTRALTAAPNALPQDKKTPQPAAKKRAEPVTQNAASTEQRAPRPQKRTQAAAEQAPRAAEPSPPRPRDKSSSRLSAARAIMHGRQIHYEAGPDRDCLRFRTDANDWVEWSLDITQPGRFQVTAEIAAAGGGRFQVTLADQTLTARVPNTGDYGRFQQVEVGTVELTSTGKTRVAVRPIAEGWQPMNLRSLDLTALST